MYIMRFFLISYIACYMVAIGFYQVLSFTYHIIISIRLVNTPYLIIYSSKLIGYNPIVGAYSFYLGI